MMSDSWLMADWASWATTLRYWTTVLDVLLEIVTAAITINASTASNAKNAITRRKPRPERSSSRSGTGGRREEGAASGRAGRRAGTCRGATGRVAAVGASVRRGARRVAVVGSPGAIRVAPVANPPAARVG